MTMVLRAKPLSDVVRGIIKRDNGCWLDASDLSTMYQDAEGTTPVTAMEQPVGLWLDKSQGLQLGPELVTNGDFSQGSTGWLYYGSGSINAVAGELAVTAAVAAPDNQAFQQVPVTYGKWYVISATVRVGSASSATLLLDGNTISFGGSTTTSTLPVRLTRMFFSITSQISFTIKARVGGVGTAYFDNISVRELKGNHATQSITASRPVVSARKNLLLATDTLSTRSVTTVAAQYTLSFTGTGTVTLSGASTAGPLVGTGANNRVSLTFTPAAGTLTLTVSGDVRMGQLEYDPAATRYQRVNTATDYDTDGFPVYLKFDGVDDYMNLPYMGLYANGSASGVTASALLRQATDACTISEGNTADADSLYCMTRQLASGGNLDSVIVRDDATVLLDTAGTASALADGVVSVRDFVDTGSSIKLFKNSGQLTSDAYTRSGAVTLNNTTIGAKVGTAAALFNNLMLYGLIITKSALSDADRRKCEVYLGRKAGVTL